MTKFEVLQVAEIKDDGKYLYISILADTGEIEIQAGTIKEAYLKDNEGAIAQPLYRFMMADHQITADCRTFFYDALQASQPSEDEVRYAASVVVEKAGIGKLILEYEPRLAGG